MIIVKNHRLAVIAHMFTVSTTIPTKDPSSSTIVTMMAGRNWKLSHPRRKVVTANDTIRDTTRLMKSSAFHASAACSNEL